MLAIKSSTLTFLFLFCFSSMALDVPRLSSPIIDRANIIDARSSQQMQQLLQVVKQKDIAQIAILTIPSLEDESLEGYSIKVTDKWQLGGKEKDNGLLILLSLKERKVRMEVGQGLEGKIPDAMSARIINEMTPFFKKGRFADGLKLGLAYSLKRLDVDPSALLKDLRSKARSRPKEKRKSSWFSLIFILVVLFLFRRNPFMLLLLLSGRGSSRSFGGGGFGGYSGGGGGFSGGGASGDW